MSKKDFFINTVRMIDVDGSTNTPTILLYEPNRSVLIGSEALAKVKSRHEINADFKIDLGNIEPTSTTPRQKFPTASGTWKSAVGLTGDFLHQLLLHAQEWLANNDIAKAASILLAEPLAMQVEAGLVSSDWLSNYRRSLERILLGEGFDKIDFLPEPFMAAYVAYLDYCVHKGRAESKLFKGFAQRSAGPLWALLQDCLRHLGNNASISAPYKDLMTPEFYGPINDAVTFVAQHKHEKVSEASLDPLRPVQILANVSQKVFATNAFGFFEQVLKQKFAREYQGLFRHACGSPPFIKTSKYQGPLAFSEDEPFLLNLDNRTALPLQPLVFWDRCINHFHLRLQVWEELLG